MVVVMAFVEMVGLMMDDSGGEDSRSMRGELLPVNGGREVHHVGFPWPLGVKFC